jgi:hypothetical protein
MFHRQWFKINSLIDYYFNFSMQDLASNIIDHSSDISLKEMQIVTERG